MTGTIGLGGLPKPATAISSRHALSSRSGDSGPSARRTACGAEHGDDELECCRQAVLDLLLPVFPRADPLSVLPDLEAAGLQVGSKAIGEVFRVLATIAQKNACFRARRRWRTRRLVRLPAMTTVETGPVAQLGAKMDRDCLALRTGIGRRCHVGIPSQRQGGNVFFGVPKLAPVSPTCRIMAVASPLRAGKLAPWLKGRALRRVGMTGMCRIGHRRTPSTNRALITGPLCPRCQRAAMTEF